MSAPYAVVLGGLGLMIAGSGLIGLNLWHEHRSGPLSGAARLVRRFVSWIVVIAGSLMILIGFAILVSPIAASI